MFADTMEIHPLCQWRQTSHANYQHACGSLRRSLITRVRRFLPNPVDFIRLVTTNKAVFGGEVALSFILREQLFAFTSLDIYVSNADYDHTCDAILDHPDLRNTLYTTTFVRNNSKQIQSCLVIETLTIRMVTGMSICVHQSYTNSPAAPITRLPCTALSNFVTGFGFACSHPELTLVHRGLLADRFIQDNHNRGNNIVNMLLSHGFSLAVSPTAWSEYQPEYTDCYYYYYYDDDNDDDNDDTDDDEDDDSDDNDDGDVDNDNDTDTDTEGDNNTDTDDDTDNDDNPNNDNDNSLDDLDECWQHRHVCPSQGRFFGDAGSLVDFFDPLGGDEVLCSENRVPPFGPMVIWRLTSTFVCSLRCDILDDVIEGGVQTRPVFIDARPASDLEEVILNRCLKFTNMFQ